ncbi:MAG: hypothetical protein P4L40_23240 [Terracidiphilus sp.]|nr:hypothetical protein [Terracidiphilus sp.]
MLLAAERRICVEQPFRAMRVQRPSRPLAAEAWMFAVPAAPARVCRGKGQRRNQVAFVVSFSYVASEGSMGIKPHPKIDPASLIAGTNDGEASEKVSRQFNPPTSMARFTNYIETVYRSAGDRTVR